jgi:rare lipoprotein A (peptidoglycan hydrolase)
VDRGPFANGASYDLTSATAEALGMTQTSRIGAVRASS